MRFDGFIFDFDGTLADTSEGVLGSVEYAIASLGLSPLSPQQLRSFIGPSLFHSFTKTVGMSEDDAMRAIGLYRSVYKPKGVYQCRLYGGMAELLTELASVGTVAVASAKPQEQLVLAAAHLGVDKIAAKVCGSDPTVRENDKADILRRAMVGSRPVMIGDSPYDIIAARDVGIPSVAVAYGFTDKAALIDAKPDFIADTVADLRQLLLG